MRNCPCCLKQAERFSLKARKLAGRPKPHCAGRVNRLEQTGDAIVHNFMRESVIIAKQDDGSLKRFYNVCDRRVAPFVRE